MGWFNHQLAGETSWKKDNTQSFIDLSVNQTSGEGFGGFWWLDRSWNSKSEAICESYPFEALIQIKDL